MERCESGFERDVLTHLLKRRYKVTVQHRVGSYRIDLVVHGERDRLAIECDGDRFTDPSNGTTICDARESSNGAAGSSGGCSHPRTTARRTRPSTRCGPASTAA